MPLNDNELNAQFEKLKNLIKEVDNISSQQRIGPNPYVHLTEKEREQQLHRQNQLNQKGLDVMVKAEKLYQKHYQDLIDAGKIKSPEEMPKIFANIKFEKELRERINPNQIPNLNFETISDVSNAESEASARSDISARTATTVARTPREQPQIKNEPKPKKFIHPQLEQIAIIEERNKKLAQSNQTLGFNKNTRKSDHEQSQISSDKTPGLIQRILNKIKDSFSNITSTVTGSTKQDNVRSRKSNSSSGVNSEQTAVIISSSPMVIVPKSTKSSEQPPRVQQQSQTDNPYATREEKTDSESKRNFPPRR